MGGGWSKRQRPPVIAASECPIYGVAPIGGHHILVAGGGGQARSGVPNLLEVFLLEPTPAPDDTLTLRCVKTTSVDTGTLATMNIALHELNPNGERGEMLVAAGQDDLCKIYRAVEAAKPMGSAGDRTPPTGALNILSFNMEEAYSFRTDFADGPPGSAFQKVVRFSPPDGRFLVTGGADGRLRLWEPSDGSMGKLEEVSAHKGEVNDVDISPDGAYILSVGSSDAACFLWSFDASNGVKKRADIRFAAPEAGEAGKKFKIRSGRFTRLGRATAVYVTVAVPVQRSSKGQRSFLSLWIYNPRLDSNRCALTNLACTETVSSLALSEDSQLTALGTLAGSVGIFETEDLHPLRWIPETHGIFVTGLAFLPPASHGPSAVSFALARDSRASLISVAADKTIQVHHLPWRETPSSTAFLAKLLAALLLLALLLRAAGL